MGTIYFGKNIKTKSGKFSDVFQSDFKKNLTRVYSLPKSLTNISNLFNGCSNLKQVGYELEDTLSDISYCFTNCTNLFQDINIPQSIKNAKHAFSHSNIKNAIFVESDEDVKEIDLSYAFSNCKNLEKVDGFISKNISNLAYCFYNSNIKHTPKIEEKNDGKPYLVNLQSMYENCRELQECNTYFSNISGNCDNIFLNCIALERYRADIIATDMNSCFDNCVNLTQIGNITAGNMNNCFSNCVNLSRIGNITAQNISEVFTNCSNLQDVNINFKDSTIETEKYYLNSSFSGCLNMSNININPGVHGVINFTEDLKQLSQNCVINLRGDYNINIENDLRDYLSLNTHAYIDGMFFNLSQYDYSYDGEQYILSRYNGQKSNICLDYRIRNNPHNSLEEKSVIFSNAFQLVSGLDTVYCRTNLFNNFFAQSGIKNFYHIKSGDSKNAINCFRDCNNLKFVKIDNSSPNISIDMFYNCYQLDTVKINTGSSSVLNISTNSFYNCSKLKNIQNFTSCDLKVGNIGDYGFYNCRNFNILLDTTPNLYFMNRYALAYVGQNLEHSITDLNLIGYSIVRSYSLHGFNSVQNLVIKYYDHDIFGDCDCTFSVYEVNTSTSDSETTFPKVFKSETKQVSVPQALNIVNSFGTTNVTSNRFGGASPIKKFILPSVHTIQEGGFMNSNVDSIELNCANRINVWRYAFSNMNNDFQYNQSFARNVVYKKGTAGTGVDNSILKTAFGDTTINIIPSSGSMLFSGVVPYCNILNIPDNIVFYDSNIGNINMFNFANSNHDLYFINGTMSILNNHNLNNVFYYNAPTTHGNFFHPVHVNAKANYVNITYYFTDNDTITYRDTLITEDITKFVVATNRKNDSMCPNIFMQYVKMGDYRYAGYVNSSFPNHITAQIYCKSYRDATSVGNIVNSSNSADKLNMKDENRYNIISNEEFLSAIPAQINSALDEIKNISNS